MTDIQITNANVATKRRDRRLSIVDLTCTKIGNLPIATKSGPVIIGEKKLNRCFSCMVIDEKVVTSKKL